MVGDDADGPVLRVHDDARTVGPLVQQGQGVGDGLARGQHDRRVQHEVARLDPADDLGDDLDRNVLRNDDQPAPPGDGFSHSAARDRRHVGDDERNSGPGAVGRGEIHGLPGADCGTSGNHEDIVVREVVGDRGEAE